jgi:protein-S-isoprenylcysteine O-methyltransferase Ste14
MRLRRSFASGSGRLALIGVVGVLLAVVAWAVTGVQAGGAGGSARTMSPGMSGTLNAVVAAAWGAAIVVLIVVVRRLRRRLEEAAEGLEPRPPRPWWVSMVAWLIVAAVFLIPLLFFRNGRDREPQPTPTPTAAPGSNQTGGTAEDRSRPSAWVIVGFVAGAAAAAAALAFAARRPASIEEDREPLPELLRHVVGVVDDSISNIERDPDPRRAIIRAYARMEAVLARGGIPRRPSETPLEYIDGALRTLAIPAAPARSITDLFEIARFSDRPIDVSMKRRAIDCLLDIRSALTAEVT